MDEIRVAWGFQGDMVGATAWVPDTPKARHLLRALMDANNAVHGAETHWMESRSDLVRMATEPGRPGATDTGNSWRHDARPTATPLR